LRTREIGAREEAERLKGSWLFVKREALAPLEDGEYYWFEIKKALVCTEEGRSLGRVKQVWDSGAHDLLLVQDEKGREVLIPVIEEVVLALDTSLKRITVRLPEGLLEAQEWDRTPGQAPTGKESLKAKSSRRPRPAKDAQTSAPQEVGEKGRDI